MDSSHDLRHGRGAAWPHGRETADDTVASRIPSRRYRCEACAEVSPVRITDEQPISAKPDSLAHVPIRDSPVRVEFAVKPTAERGCRAFMRDNARCSRCGSAEDRYLRANEQPRASEVLSACRRMEEQEPRAVQWPFDHDELGQLMDRVIDPRIGSLMRRPTPVHARECARSATTTIVAEPRSSVHLCSRARRSSAVSPSSSPG